MNKEEIRNKMLKVGVLCGGRTSGRTYENFLRIYRHAKINGYSDVEVTFIDPELNKLQQRINKAIEYIENNSLYEEEYDYDYEENLYLSGIEDGYAKKDLLEILKGDSNE